MRSKVTTQPLVEPVSLAELKSSLRITNTAEDLLLKQYITDARIFAENVTGKKFINQTITAYYDFRHNDKSDKSDKSDWWDGTITGSMNALYGQQKIPLEFGPAVSVTSVDTIDTGNAETTFASSGYYLDNYDDFMRPQIMVNEGVSIVNTDLRASNNVKTVYVAGYGASASDVPSSIRRAIQVLAGKLYSNRGDCSTDQCSSECGADVMLNQYMYHNA